MQEVIAACEWVNQRAAVTGGHAGTAGQQPPAAAVAARNVSSAVKKQKAGQRAPNVFQGAGKLDVNDWVHVCEESTALLCIMPTPLSTGQHGTKLTCN